MEAGHYLDVLVADKVMGWTDWRTWEPNIPVVKPVGENTRRFSPSTDVGHAMEVAERMRADWFSFKLWQPSSDHHETPQDVPQDAVVSFICSAGPCPRHGTTFHNHHGAYDVQGKTLPLAICMAALIALKVLPAPEREWEKTQS